MHFQIFSLVFCSMPTLTSDDFISVHSFLFKKRHIIVRTDIQMMTLLVEYLYID